MKKHLLYISILTTAIVVILYILICDTTQLSKYFSVNLRGNLFAGFLTVGGFLFSLKTFIVIKMKENVYDHEKYQERVAEQQQLNGNISFYGPLRRLSDLLFISVLASICCAVLQLTVGLIDHWFTVLLCIWSAIFASALLIWSLFIIKSNLNDWFEFLEDSKKT